MVAWQTKSSSVVYRNPWFSVREDEIVNHNGTPQTYSVIDLASPSVFIAALNSKGEILMQREFRYTIGRDVWGIPAGHSDGEDLLSAAKRELLEETGMTSSDWTELPEMFAMVGIGNCPSRAYIARDVKLVTDERDPEEPIGEQKFVAIGEVDAMVRRGEIASGAVIACLYQVRLALAGDSLIH